MFSLIGGAEQAGSGADKIVRGWESAHWQRPYLEVKDQPDRVTLELEMESILSEQVRERMFELFGERADSLFGDRKTVLAIVAMEGTVTHRSLRYRVDMHAADLSSLLKTLCQESYLISTGWGSGTTYTLNEKNTPPRNIAIQEAISTKNVESLAGEEDSSAEKKESLPNNVESLPNNVESLPNNVESLPNNQSAQQRLNQQILQTASIGWCTLPELAEATGKSSKYLINRIIPLLVSAGQLERRYSQATHPNQAYRTVE